VQLLAPQLDHEDHTKDVDFTTAAFNSVGTRVRPHQGSACARALGRPIRSALRMILHEAEEVRARCRVSGAQALLAVRETR